jgi:hypothetical protein
MSTGLTILTIIHVAISLVAIVTGLVAASGLLASRRWDRWTAVFLATTVATSATGFLFPLHGFTPAIGTGIVSLLVLPVAIFARYGRGLNGAWRWIYIIASMFALYLNVFVLVVQLFLKIPALHALAPNQTEPAFAVAQGSVLLLFVIWTVVAVLRFRWVVTKAASITPSRAA